MARYKAIDTSASAEPAMQGLVNAGFNRKLNCIRQLCSLSGEKFYPIVVIRVM